MSQAILEIEGTWEEVAARAPELVGRRVRLTVLQEDTLQSEEALYREHPLLRHIGTWQGNDLEECLAAVVASRSPITVGANGFDQHETSTSDEQQ